MDTAFLQDLMVFVTLIVSIGCFTGIIITFIKRRGKAFSTPEMLARLNEISDRLGRLEDSTDATALEVERISEAQRFTAKVLAERNSAPKLPERKSITPH